MTDEATYATTNSAPRSAWWRGFLLLSLIPLGVALFALAQLPIPSLMGYHDISEDGRFVLTGYLDDDGMDFRLLSLADGKLIRFQGIVAGFSQGSVYWYDQILGKRLDLDSRRVIDLGSLDARLIWQKEDWAYRRFSASLTHPGIMATLNSAGDLCILDFPTAGMTSVSLPAMIGHGWHPIWCGSSQRLFVVEISNGATKGNDRVLYFSYVDGKIEKLAEWKATQVPIVADGRILSLTSDLQLEIRQLSDGTLIQREPLAAALDLTVPITTRPLSVWLTTNRFRNEAKLGVETGLVEVKVRPTRHLLYDYLEQQLKWEDSNLRAQCAELRFGKASYIHDRAVEVLRLVDGVKLMRVEFPSWVYSARFIAGGEQILVMLNDESVHVCDVASGRIVQTFRSQGWVVPTFVALMAGFAVWCCLWVKQSVQHEVSPRWDVLIFSVLILSGLMLRVFLVGSLRDPNRLIYQFLEAFGVSWLIMLGLWFIFGKTRWSVKVIGPLLGLVGVLLIAMIVFRGPKQPLWEFLVAVLGITATVIMTFGVARKLGWRLVSAFEGHQRSDRKLESRVPLRDLFLVFVVAGLFFSVLRFIPAGAYDRKSMEMLAILLVVVAISAVGGVWSALTPRHWLLRVVFFVLLVNLAAAVCAIFYPGLRTLPEWLNQLRFAGSVSGFTCALLLVFRVRGWRLTRGRHAPP